MKTIKFDLAVGGVKVKNIDELREYFTTEILDHYRSGRLDKWLNSRNLNSYSSSLKDLDGEDEKILLKKLCNIFDVASDDISLQALYNKASTKSDINESEDSTLVDNIQPSDGGSDFSEETFNQNSLGDVVVISDSQMKELLSADHEDNIKDLLNDIKEKRIPDALQHKLSEIDGEIIKIALSRNQFINEEIQTQLANTGTSKIREALAENPALIQKMQVYLATTGSEDVKIVLAQNEALAEEVQTLLVDDEAWRVREALAGNSRLVVSCMSRLMDDDDIDVKAALASNSALLSEFQDILAENDRDEIICGLARNKNLKEILMIKFSRASGNEIKKTLARNSSLPESLQAKLISTNNDDVKIELAQNESLAIGQQAELAKSTNADILVVLFDNPSLSKDIRLKVIQKVTSHDLSEAQRQLAYLEDEREHIHAKRMEVGESLNKVIFGSSLFNPMSKVDRLQSEMDKLEENERELRDKVDFLFYKIERIESILALKK
ncbi:hypothetical protein IVG45_19020 [Methylomonas sp. LL1]|uniref:hypothetical protein n=1 Tax=Methylomonas sp. LL1 TaxID=2785785 RepID=UPI0018C39D02|nr:hypothetical protein [Methylomonas sp. LL1]QPK62894.1 hypothetical protein IVG45_19020 [Methylomonas sp. LL1]